MYVDRGVHIPKEEVLSEALLIPNKGEKGISCGRATMCLRCFKREQTYAAKQYNTQKIRTMNASSEHSTPTPSNTCPIKRFESNSHVFEGSFTYLV